MADLGADRAGAPVAGNFLNFMQFFGNLAISYVDIPWRAGSANIEFLPNFLKTCMKLKEF